MPDMTPLVPEEMPQEPKIVAFLDDVAKAMGTPTRREAHLQNLCVVCLKEITQEQFASWSEAGRREYAISGCCEPCFDLLFGSEE